MSLSLLDRRVARFFLLFSCVLSLASASCHREAPVPQPGSDEYRKTVAAFYVGLSSLQVGDDSRAECYLTWTTQLAPEEPAGWVNLGLLQFRQREFDKAFAQLNKARELAPDDARIHVLLASVESNRGHYDEAIKLLRRAVELDPQNARAAYALAGETERAGGAEADNEALRLLQSIAAQQPGNLFVQLEVARLAAKTNDAATLSQTVKRIGVQPAVMSPEAQEQFKALEAAAGGANPRLAANRVAFLRNVLARVPQFRQDIAAVRIAPEEGGAPFLAFVRMKTPAPVPATPDEGIAFSGQNITPQQVDVKPSWAWSGVVSLTGEGAPLPLAANSSSVRLSNKVELPFPGSGKERTEPKPNGVLGADLNYDFKIDLVFAGSGGVRIFRQETADKWTDMTARAGLPEDVLRAAYYGAWAADVDLDGDLDIVLGKPEGAPAVLRNNGDDTFKLLSLFADTNGVRDFAWADMDADGDPDAVLLDGAGSIKVFANERGGQFTRLPELPIRDRVRAMCVADVSRDGQADVVAWNAGGDIARFSYKAGAPPVGATPAASWDASRIARWQAGGSGEKDSSLPSFTPELAQLFAADMDNNGGLDLVASREGETAVWLSDAADKFNKINSAPQGHVFAVADMNGDGRLDLVGNTSDVQPTVWLTRGAKDYHWLVLRPRAQQTEGDQRFNSFGIGGEMEARAGLLAQKQIINSPLVHFGLGEQTNADVVRIVWSNGSPRAEFDLKSDQVVLAEQRLKGSCPSLFAWDGREMSFVKDCSPWSSALGLRINAQETAGILQPEEWMKIPGDRLAPRRSEDGTTDYYDLRITAELWETYYIDHYALMTVDHPAGTDIFVDERFSVPPPKLKIYTVTTPRPFAGAIDDKGEDVSDIVSQTDSRYLDSFGRGRYQGITRDHWIELQLPDDARAENLRLIAHGWMHPTDASINVAISQGTVARPESLSLEIPDERGGWHAVQKGLGFPAGKLKTIVMELDDAVRQIPAGAPRRLRLRTNLEIYWDRLTWATEVAGDATEIRRFSPASAELSWRGFSDMTQADRSSPETPSYDRIANTTQKWRDLAGYYTRYGDIRELLKERDDRIVIVNAGDEMRFRFPASPAPPTSIVRDFVMIGDGWIKDGDYNSVFSQTVLPLPRHGQGEYLTLPKRLEDDPVYLQHQDDWQRFHTRYVSPDTFQNLLRAK